MTLPFRSATTTEIPAGRMRHKPRTMGQASNGSAPRSTPGPLRGQGTGVRSTAGEPSRKPRTASGTLASDSALITSPGVCTCPEVYRLHTTAAGEPSPSSKARSPSSTQSSRDKPAFSAMVSTRAITSDGTATLTEDDGTWGTARDLAIRLPSYHHGGSAMMVGG